MDEDKYQKVIDACALGPDLNILSEGDETFVGVNGLTLSGGQKTRVALARACYAEKEIYLFDDPLSAVDAHVSKHIYNNCITDFLSNKTRIVCTHHIDYLTNADLVLIVENGQIVKSGPGNEIISNMSDSKKSFKLSNKKTIFDDHKEDVLNTSPSLLDHKKALHEAEIHRQQENEKEQGVIDFKVYKYYCVSNGVLITVLTLLILTLMQGKYIILD